MENTSPQQENPLYVTWEALGEVDAPDPETLATARRAAKKFLDRRLKPIEDPVLAAGVRAELEARYEQTVIGMDEIAERASIDVNDPAYREVRAYVSPRPDDSIAFANMRYRPYSAEAMGGHEEAHEYAFENVVDAVQKVRDYHAFESRLDSLTLPDDTSMTEAKSEILKYSYPLDAVRSSGMLKIAELSAASDEELKNLLESTASFNRVGNTFEQRTKGGLSQTQLKFLLDIMPMRQREISDIQAYSIYSLNDDELGDYCDMLDRMPAIVEGLNGSRLANVTDRAAFDDFAKMQDSLDRLGQNAIAEGARDSAVAYGKKSFVALMSNYDLNDETVRAYFSQLYESATEMPFEAARGFSSHLESILSALRDNPCVSDEQAFRYVSFLPELVKGADANEREHRMSKNEISEFWNYSRLHLLDDSQIEGFRRMFKRYEKGDPETDILDLKDNSHGMEYGDYGISDYTIACLVRPISPLNIQELIQAYREIPTSDQAKFMQNRVDALNLQQVLFAGRDFVHDERPHAHDVLAAILKYYDSDEQHHAQAEAEVRRIIEGANMASIVSFDNYAANSDNYEKIVNDRNEKAIDVLRRLVKNTEADPIEAPECNDIQLNQLLRDVDVLIGVDGVPKVELSEISDLVTYVNQKLQAETGQYSCDASLIRALSYTERLATYAMRRVNERDRRELFYDPTFKEIVKFRDLTSSDDAFDERKFESFWSDFSRIPADADEEQVSAQYGKLSMHIYEQLSKLAKRSSLEHGQASGRRIMALWSGNLNHELIGLTDSR